MQNTFVSNLEWCDGQPYSKEYGDVYFSSNPNNPQQGYDETNYVFITQNKLVERFNALTATQFTIAETGFGTGLNLLCTCKLWLKTAPENAHLHFISIEKTPLSFSDMQQAHALWPNLANESKALLSNYNVSSSGLNRFNLYDRRITLSLLVGDVNALLPSIEDKIDAWYLDGFSPSKNPDMWSQHLFNRMAKLSDIHTTFATFTSAGIVRRGLESVGFKVIKKPGFGKKREMLTGYFIPTNSL